VAALVAEVGRILPQSLAWLELLEVPLAVEVGLALLPITASLLVPVAMVEVELFTLLPLANYDH
jgi:hypothetical protein